MADIEVNFIGRISSPLAGEPDCLLFATPDSSQVLPIWVEGARDMAGRPSAASVLATVISSDRLSDPWTAEISTVSRGQYTARLMQGERTIDIKPSILEPLWHAGVLFDVKIKEELSNSMLDFNAEWICALRNKLQAQALADASDSSNNDGQFYMDWNHEASEIDGHSPDVVLDEISDEAFDDELKKLLGE